MAIFENVDEMDKPLINHLSKEENNNSNVNSLISFKKSLLYSKISSQNILQDWTALLVNFTTHLREYNTNLTWFIHNTEKEDYISIHYMKLILWDQLNLDPITDKNVTRKNFTN